MEYLYDGHLRQMLRKQRNKGERARLARHIFYGNFKLVRYPF
ncbi:hypothetical protein D1631_17180 [Chryseobacterium nematophagum]|uniref:Uncharacterized protein n=1 Tax=Chryseobacterium nematophagum TaxID=2305228 RepID=A0A3M7TMM8_9FLAO|nr:hypothetical protein D1631_17180 [Chryseobacterium nematophagum]